jgi:outer membrane receptor protein involved in Fe transport
MDVDVATHANKSYTFSGQFSGDGFADFLMGFPSSSILELAPNSSGQFRATNQAYYVLDNWKVAQNLTLNLGGRYEYDAPQKELGGQTPLFDARGVAGLLFPKQNTTALAWYQKNRPDLPVGLLTRETEYQPDTNNLAPRVGFAWRPFHSESTVVRGGYGIFFSTGEVADYGRLAWPSARLALVTVGVNGAPVFSRLVPASCHPRSARLCEGDIHE